MCGNDPPAFGKACPGLHLPAGPAAAQPPVLAGRRRKVAAEGRDDDAGEAAFEALRVAAPGEPGIAVTVRRAVYQGGRTDVDTVVDGTQDCRLTLALPVDTPPPPGAPLRLTIHDGWVVPTEILGGVSEDPPDSPPSLRRRSRRSEDDPGQPLRQG